VLAAPPTTPAARRMAGLVAATLPNARRAVIPGAGHMAPQSHAITLAEMLKEFWASVA
jgi:hypothetical protein